MGEEEDWRKRMDGQEAEGASGKMRPTVFASLDEIGASVAVWKIRLK